MCNRPPLPPPPPKDAFDFLICNRPNNTKKKKPKSPQFSKKEPRTLTEEDTLLKVEALNEDVLPLTKKTETLTLDWSKKDDKIALLKNKGYKFKPKSAAFWEPGKPIPFVFLAKAFDLASKNSSRIVITDILVGENEFFNITVIATTPGDLVSFDLSVGKIYPTYDGIEFGIAKAGIIKSTQESGRLGSKLDNSKKPAPLTVAGVLDAFLILAKVSGEGSEKRKRKHVRDLLVAAGDCEPQYIIRILQSKLRIGFSDQTLLTALGSNEIRNCILLLTIRCIYITKKQKIIKTFIIMYPIKLTFIMYPITNFNHINFHHKVSLFHHVYLIMRFPLSLFNNYETIVSAILSDGVLMLPDTCPFVLGVPISPMLAKPTNGVSEILRKFQKRDLTCEYKYDGERAQIHYLEDGSVQIFSRNAVRNTGKFPDVIQSVQRFKKPSVSSFILDCELVAFDRENNKILSFQKLSGRSRTNVPIDSITIPVCIIALDILYLNGELLLQEQLNVRRKYLYDSFVEVPGEFKFVTQLTSNDLQEIQTFLDTAIAGSCEEPAKRSNNWLKLKKDYMDNTGDSLDLVPIGAYYGRGKRTGGFGGFLLACYDDKKEEFQSICKIGSGFSEQMLKELSSRLESQVIRHPKSCYRFTDATKPDVWFEPAEVEEDKKPEDATTSGYSGQVSDMYLAQKINHGNK
ncbi:hypothetical protein MKX03_031546 [Papaver bracteatum]|nr:hypothetical protein MKX03_031546 [Papaver bracteatum]